MSYIFIIICFLYGLCAVYFAKKTITQCCVSFSSSIISEHYSDLFFKYSIINLDYYFSLVKEVMLYFAVFLYIFRRKKITGGKKTIILSLVLVIIFVENLIVTDTSFQHR